jgi:hypothetical protein
VVEDGDVPSIVFLRSVSEVHLNGDLSSATPRRL